MFGITVAHSVDEEKDTVAENGEALVYKLYDSLAHLFFYSRWNGSE